MQNLSLTNMNGRWKLKFERSDVIFAGFDSRQEAMEFCSEMACNSPACLKIHRPDGTLMEVRNFSPLHASSQAA